MKEAAKNIFDVPLSLKDGVTTTFRAILDNDFPTSRPRLQVIPSVKHRFLDQSGFIFPSAHHYLAQWNGNTSLLGSVMFEIATIIIQETPAYNSQPVFNSAPVHQQTVLNLSNPSPPPYTETVTTVNSIPTSFPELESKSLSELQQICNNNTAFMEFIDSLEYLKNYQSVKEDLLKTNDELKKKMIEKEKDIVSLHSEYEEKLIKLAERRSTHDQTLTAQDDILKKYSGRAVIRALAVLAQEADAQSRDYLN